MGNILAGVFSFLASNPTLINSAIGLLSQHAPSLSPILTGLSNSFLHTAPVDPATNKPVPTAEHPIDAIKILQTIINVPQSCVAPGAKRIAEDGVYGPETYGAAKALLAKAGVTI